MQQTELYALVFAVGLVPSAITQADTGLIIEVNDALCAALGYTRSELLGAPIEIINPELGPRAWQTLWRRVRRDGRVAVETRHWHKDGSVTPVEVVLNHLTVDGEELCVAFATDISARKDAEEALRTEARSSRATVESLIQGLREPVMLWDIEGNIMFNDAMLAFYRVPNRASFLELARHKNEFIEAFTAAGERMEPDQRLWARAFRGESGIDVEVLLRRVDTGEQWSGAFCFGPVRDSNGGIIAAYQTARDITAIREAEAELRRATDLAEESSRAKSRFLANMSHEIRTPMNAIMGMTELMQRDSDLPPRQAERLDRVRVASRHLLSIVNDILDLSKIEAGRFELDLAPLDPAELVRQTTAMISELAERKGIRILTRVGELPTDLAGDRGRISQMLLNYLGNAVKFTERGQIDVEVSLIESSSSSARLRFTVRDTGIGIPSAMQSRLFNAFEQADTSSTREFGGTGLGLAINRRLATLMAGDVGWEPAPAGGSEFWFTITLPRSAAIAATRSDWKQMTDLNAEQLLARRHAGKRVLIAEDDEINRLVAAELLERTGLVLEFAQNGQEAVERAVSGAFDLILMDLQMPVMGGIVATQCIRSKAACASVPIIAMTANAYDDDREDCLTAGMVDHIAKPIEPELLYRTLETWLSARS